MKYAKFGRTGLSVSKITLGMMSFGNSQSWQLELDDAKPLVEKAIDLGINVFDTANVYSRGRSEEITGELLKDYREDVIIATKVRFAMGENQNNKGLNRSHLHRQIEASLLRLQTDFIDLYQIHRWDYSVNIEFVMRTLNQYITEGHVGHIGASSMYAWELAKAQYTADQLGLERFVSMQNHYNAIYREEEREMIPQCVDMGMAIVPWSPLARGFLSGKYQKQGENTSKRYQSDPYLKQRYFADNDFQVLEALKEVSQEHDISVAQTALAWILNQPEITSPIIGVTKMYQLEEAVEACSIKLDSDQLKRINEAYLPRSVIGHGYDQPDTMINSQNKSR